MRRIDLAVALDVVSGSHLRALDNAGGWQSQRGECHASTSLLMRKVPPGSADSRTDWLVRFLFDHHAPDPAVRAALVAWLVEG